MNNLWKGTVAEYNKMLDEQNTKMEGLQDEAQAQEDAATEAMMKRVATKNAAVKLTRSILG